ncbi:hypothetical protein CEXT_674791 [Caerostris extrusa]|nr:hypothetical protein CEXT_674791 [Caerostris extrusa]
MVIFIKLSSKISSYADGTTVFEKELCCHMVFAEGSSSCSPHLHEAISGSISERFFKDIIIGCEQLPFQLWFSLSNYNYEPEEQTR